jgi:hypothetical protein
VLIRSSSASWELNASRAGVSEPRQWSMTFSRLCRSGPHPGLHNFAGWYRPGYARQ